MTKLLNFVLIELLVVVAVIAVLAATLLPALGSARRSVKRIVCSGNQRQIYQGCLLYVSDYDGWLPPGAYGSGYIYFCNAYLKQRYALGATWDGYGMRLGAIIFSKPEGLYFCPETKRASDSPCWDGSAEAPFYQTTYSPTVKNIRGADPRSGCWNIYDENNLIIPARRLESVKDGCVIFGESNFTSVGLNFTTSQTNICYVLLGGSITSLFQSPSGSGPYAPGWNHNLSSNFAFKDGHVQSSRYNRTTLFDSDYHPLK